MPNNVAQFNDVVTAVVHVPEFNVGPLRKRILPEPEQEVGCNRTGDEHRPEAEGRHNLAAVVGDERRMAPLAAPAPTDGKGDEHGDQDRRDDAEKPTPQRGEEGEGAGGGAGKGEGDERKTVVCDVGNVVDEEEDEVKAADGDEEEGEEPGAPPAEEEAEGREENKRARALPEVGADVGEGVAA